MVKTPQVRDKAHISIHLYVRRGDCNLPPTGVGFSSSTMPHCRRLVQKVPRLSNPAMGFLGVILTARRFDLVEVSSALSKSLIVSILLL